MSAPSSVKSFINRFLLVTGASLASLVMLASPTFALVGDVIVSEFMANPDNSVVISDNGGEWVELKNTTSVDIDLTGWSIDGALLSPGVILPANGTIVICRNSNPLENGGVTCDGTANFQLSNTGDTIELLNELDVEIDSVLYTDTNVADGKSTNVLRDVSNSVSGLVIENSADFGLDTQSSLQNGSPGVASLSSGAVLNVEDNLYFSSFQDALNADTMNSGETLRLNQDISTDSQITIRIPVTIDGSGFTVSPIFAKPCPTCNDNNSVFGVIGTSNVTIKNILINGSGGTDLHGINVYESTNVSVNDSTINNNRAAIIVNGSIVSASNLNTSGNLWYSVNIDQGSGVSLPAEFTISGVNTHDEAFQIVLQNNTNTNLDFVDFNNSYTKNTFGTVDVFNLTIPYVPTAPPTKPIVTGEVIYDSIPSVLPSNSISIGYQATSTSALGDKITFAGTSRKLDKVAVTLSSWACESGDWNNNCITTPGANFTHPITLNLYNVASDGSVGSLINSTTQTFTIPYRPTADLTCNSTTQWRDTNDECFNGINHVVVFDATGITVPNNIIYSVSFNTQNYGTSPLGVNGPFNSLNVSLSTGAALVGVNQNLDEVFWDTTYPWLYSWIKASRWTVKHRKPVGIVYCNSKFSTYC